MPGPTAFEQMLLELANRIRLDPGSEFDRIVADAATRTAHDPDTTQAIRFFEVDMALLEAELDALAPVQPLAWSDKLATAAGGHSAVMIQRDEQSHWLEGYEPKLAGRLADAGYIYSVAGENVFAYTRSPAHGHDGFIVDWGWLPDGSPSPDGMQNPRGHRDNLMSAAYREMGVSALPETNSATSVGPWVMTQNLGARSNTGPFLLGVAYADVDGDDFYSIGEGRSGLTVAASGRGAVATGEAGGYALQVGEGMAQVTLSGGPAASTMEMSVQVGRDNVKLDLVDGSRLLTSGNLQLLSGGARVIEALGVAEVELVGAAGAEELRGNASANRLAGQGGNDRLLGHGGDDELLGGDGWDTLFGGWGADRLYGGNRGDFLHGEQGADFLWGGEGDDQLWGGGGDDRLWGGARNDTLYGGNGADQLFGNEGDDVLSGGAGDDLLHGWTGDDTLYGGPGADRLSGQDGADRLFGGDDADSLDGGAGEDLLSGGDGADNLRGQDGVDVLHGGAGHDGLHGGSGGDTLHGDAGNDWLHGDMGDDRLYGGEGFDNLFGGDGSDMLAGGAEGDRLEGGAGSDWLYGGDGWDTLYGGDGWDTLQGGSGNDHLHGGANADVFVFGANQGRDTIHDWEPWDRVRLTDGLSASDIVATSDAADAIWTFAGTAVVLVGQAGLAPDDFIV